jgi:hypothetical protein
MKEFKIFVNNKAGELARVTEALATHAVNIKAISSEGGHEKSFLRIITGDVSTTEKALKNAGLGFDLNEIFDLELLDVNVESIYILGSKGGKTHIAMVVSDLARAKTALA